MLERRAVSERLALEAVRIRHQKRNERDGLLVGNLVEERQRCVVQYAELHEHAHGHRARLEAAERIVLQRREPIRLALRAARLGEPVFVMRVDRRLRRLAVGPQLQEPVVELIYEIPFAHAQPERNRRAIALPDRDGGIGIFGESAVPGEPQDFGAQHLGGRDEARTVFASAEMDVTRDYALEVEDTAVPVEVAALHERDVDGATRPLVARDGLVAVPRVDFGVGANRLCSRREVDFVPVLVENAADLLARKRPDAAFHERLGRQGIGREPDPAADLGQGVHPHTAF